MKFDSLDKVKPGTTLFYVASSYILELRFIRFYKPYDAWEDREGLPTLEYTVEKYYMFEDYRPWRQEGDKHYMILTEENIPIYKTLAGAKTAAVELFDSEEKEVAAKRKRFGKLFK